MAPVTDFYVQCEVQRCCHGCLGWRWCFWRWQGPGTAASSAGRKFGFTPQCLTLHAEEVLVQSTPVPFTGQSCMAACALPTGPHWITDQRSEAEPVSPGGVTMMAWFVLNVSAPVCHGMNCMVHVHHTRHGASALTAQAVLACIAELLTC